MRTLSEQLVSLSAHSRAVPWRVRFYSGLSTSSPTRDYQIFAPPTHEASEAVLKRLHNGIILLNPVAVELQAPVEPDRLEPLLGALRAMHTTRIVLHGEPLLVPLRGAHLPSVDVPHLRAPGPGLSAGLDIGGTNMKACVMQDQTVVRVDSAPTWPEGELGIDSLVARSRALLMRVAAGAPLGSLGIGLASPMGVGGQVLELSTMMRSRVGDVSAFDHFSERVSAGLVDGPVAIFNDLSNLGRYLSSQGLRRFVRVQIGTSFGGCWIDTDGLVYATEMARLMVDVDKDALSHPYLPLVGAMKRYLSNSGVADYLSKLLQEPVETNTAGHRLRALLEQGDPRGQQTIVWMGAVLRGVLDELHALLPGVTLVECGGSMLSGPAGPALHAAVGTGAVPLRISRQPAHDGAIAAALAPRVDSWLRAMRRVG